jgi:adenosine deaminase
MIKTDLNTFLQKMPKVELHIHLEGSIPPEALWELVKKYKGTAEVKNIGELKNKFKYTDFPHFIETWVWKNRFINEYDDFTLIADEVAEKLISQNIKYVEMFYSPPDFMHRGLEPQKITGAVYKGINKHKNEITINLVADLVRDFGVKNAKLNLEKINEARSLNVVGIGIGGSEHAFPPGLFKDVYESARKMDFHTSAHAGEAAGAESIWGALKELKAERIGHATRAFEDESLVEYLGDNKIPLEMCPISNVRTGVVSSIDKHPVKDFYDKGLNVFVNTDDPEMFNNTMVDEYTACIARLGFGKEDIKQLLLNAVRSAWCEENKKISLEDEIINYFKSNSF